MQISAPKTIDDVILIPYLATEFYRLIIYDPISNVVYQNK